jgi:hypothetical protein
MAPRLPGVEFEADGRIASKMWTIREMTAENRKNRQNLIFVAYILSRSQVGWRCFSSSPTAC